MSAPQYRDLIIESALTNNVTPERAAQMVSEMEETTGFVLLRWGISARILLLQREIVSLSPWNEPGEIAGRQAEIAALEFVADGFVREMEQMYVALMAEKKRDEETKRDEEYEEVQNLPIGI